MARKIIEFIDCRQIFRSDISYKGLQQEAQSFVRLLYELILTHSRISQPNVGLKFKESEHLALALKTL